LRRMRLEVITSQPGIARHGKMLHESTVYKKMEHDLNPNGNF
jgi:hypothetical protein